jgi:hypothetical protein
MWVETPPDPQPMTLITHTSADTSVGWIFLRDTRGIPIWRGSGRFGDDLYGFDLSGGKGKFGIGAVPLLNGPRGAGYAAGFRLANAEWELRGDLREARGTAGRQGFERSLTAALLLHEDVRLRLQYLSRSTEGLLDPRTEDMVGGSLEFGL